MRERIILLLTFCSGCKNTSEDSSGTTHNIWCLTKNSWNCFDSRLQTRASNRHPVSVSCGYSYTNEHPKVYCALLSVSKKRSKVKSYILTFRHLMKETFACQSLDQQSILLLYQWNYGFSAMNHPQTGIKCSVTLIKLMLRTFEFSWDLHCKKKKVYCMNWLLEPSDLFITMPSFSSFKPVKHMFPSFVSISRCYHASLLPCCVITEQTSAHRRAITGLKKTPFKFVLTAPLTVLTCCVITC